MADHVASCYFLNYVRQTELVISRMEENQYAWNISFFQRDIKSWLSAVFRATYNATLSVQPSPSTHRKQWGDTSSGNKSKFLSLQLKKAFSVLFSVQASHSASWNLQHRHEQVIRLFPLHKNLPSLHQGYRRAIRKLEKRWRSDEGVSCIKYKSERTHISLQQRWDATRLSILIVFHWIIMKTLALHGSQRRIWLNIV